MSVKRSNIGEILAACRDRLLKVRAISTPDQVLFVCKGQLPPHAIATKDVLFRIGGYSIDWDNAGGRWGGKKIRVVEVYARLGQAIDKGYTDEKWLGQLDEFEDSILNGLLDFLPEDDQGNALTTETLHLMNAREPQKEDDDVWGYLVATYEIHYQPKGVDPTDPG